MSETTPTISILAGMASTLIFTCSTIPMLVKAFRTKDLQSYSLSNMILANTGNLIHWFYVMALPFGPLWFLHGFYTITTAMMLLWYLRYRRRWSGPLDKRVTMVHRRI